MSSYVTPELLYFAVKWSELQHWCNLPRNFSQNTSPSQGSLSQGLRVAKHTCALSTVPPLLQVWAQGLGAESSGCLQNCDSICERFIDTWGLCRPLQLYFVLNEWVIRRPVVHTEPGRGPTGRGPHRDTRRKNSGLSLAWHTLALCGPCL